MTTRTYDANSQVENVELTRSGRKLMYGPTEKIPVIEVENSALIGKLTAFRFIEWVLKNPGGVISLPTGKTPERFIKWTNRILSKWTSKEIQGLLSEYGINGSTMPDMKSLTFVQMDEFYPMNSHQHNSSNNFIKKFYMDSMGLDANKAILIDATNLGVPAGRTMEQVFPNYIIDLSLRFRKPKNEQELLQKEVITSVDMFCMDFETRIRDLGGIGFFVGSIGPDGHIAYNVRGSGAYSVTRLTGTNYETQASSSTDLGGIEVSRNRLVITIGLATITYNPTATVLILAAGDGKVPVVKHAVEEKKHQLYPASVLQDLPYARFYCTKGVAGQLTERKLVDFSSQKSIGDTVADEVVIALSVSTGKPLHDLTKDDFNADPFAKELLRISGKAFKDLTNAAYDRIVKKIEKGVSVYSATNFLHTEPHQDDVMLGYFGLINHLFRDGTNHHSFANLTSGFTSVTNQYCLSLLLKLKSRIDSPEFTRLLAEGYFSPSNAKGKMEDVYLFLDGSAAYSKDKKDEAEARRVLRNLTEVYATRDLNVIKYHFGNLEHYLSTQYPGAKDPPDIQKLKGTIREWEAELLWGYFGMEAKDVHALRLGFYQGDIFSDEPQVNRDVVPIYELMLKVKPNVISVAFDPEASGPDTHYKALQAVAEAVKIYEKENPADSAKLKIWGYRNVWFKFKPSESNYFVPVSLNTLSQLHNAFMNCFGSQSAASFPSSEHDGPFSELAQKNQVDQYTVIKTCLGHDYFLKNSNPRLRAARGMIFLKEMELPEFFEKVRELKKVTEAV